MKALFFFALLSPASLLSQQLGVPSSGFVFDPSAQALRSMRGVVGASTLGAVLPAALNITTAAVCSSKQFAIVAIADSSSPAIVKLSDSSVMNLLGQNHFSASQIVLNRSCTAGLLYSSATNQVQVISGLPSKPSIDGTFSPAGAGATSFALSDDGLTILYVLPAGAVYMVQGAGTPQAILPLTGQAAVAFGDGHEAWVADSDGNQILHIQNVAAPGAPDILAGPDAGILSPTSIGYDSPRKLVLIGNRGNLNVGVLNPADQSLNFFACACETSFSLIEKDLYQVAAPTDDSPLLVLDLGNSTPRVLFVAVRQ
jgi:hypothetical protein